MDFRTLAAAVPQLIVERNFQDAERSLQQAYDEVNERGDLDTLEHVCALFVQLYSSFDPPQIERAVNFSVERERIKPSAYNRLQTATVIYQVARDPKRAAEKVREAVEIARKESNSTAMYSALSLLGQSLLDMNENAEAADVLDDLERIIATGKPIVVGDETPFLEKAFERDVATSRVRRIAGMLAPVCRDPDFGQRLADLAK